MTELLRHGAQQLIAQAVEAQLHELLADHAQHRTESGQAAVVRNVNSNLRFHILPV